MEHSKDRAGSRGGPLAWPTRVWLRVLTMGPLTVHGSLNGLLGRPLRGPFEGPSLQLEGHPPQMPKLPVMTLTVRVTIH